MAIMSLVKMIKLAWFELPELQSAVKDLVALGSVSERHLLVSLQAMEELIVEMGYVVRGKNLHVHRRISVNFRDTDLFLFLNKSLEQVYKCSDSLS